MIIHIQRHRLSEMLQVVRALEENGYECVCRIRKIPKWHKNWEWNEKNKFRNFRGVDEHTIYFVKMRKVD